MLRRILIAGAIALLLPTASPSFALDKPKGEVILRVTGNVGTPNDGKVAAFDLDMLEALKGRKASMETPWTKGKTEFQGPLIRAILAAAGADGKVLKVKALNDYSSDIPIADAKDLDTILAVRMNSKLMSVRDKGPLFMIYPFDTNPELYNEKYFSRSVWQVMEVEVVN